MNEQEYQQSLIDSGVDLPELQDINEDIPEKPEDVEEKEPKKVEEKSETEPEDDGENDDEEPKPVKKRSIYDDLKDKKREVKTERELREIAERERDELKEKLENINKAETPSEKSDAIDEFDEFAQEIDADPAIIKKMRDLILKGMTIPKELQEGLTEFKAWKAENSKTVEKQRFQEELTAITPTLKEYFPTASETELQEIKDNLDKLAHSEGWHDKELDYIVFKNKDTLGKLVSPKKKGMESTGKVDDIPTDSNIDDEFDPNPDFSKMTPAQLENWNTKYQNFSKSGDGLHTNKDGKKLII